MRKIIALIGIFLFLTASSNVDQSTDPMVFIQQAYLPMEEYVEEIEWNVLIKEQIHPKKLKELLNMQGNGTLVTSKNTENVVKYTMGINENQHMSATMTISDYQQYGQAEVMVEINGAHWNKEIEEEYEAFVANIQRTYFSRNARVFACLTATYSATIDRNEFIEKNKKTLQLQYVSELKDPLTDPKDQQIWYGYTPRLTEAITIDNENTNVQIVVNTKEDQQFTVFIGTPIIIHEY